MAKSKISQSEIIRLLRAELLQGQYKVGDRLPSLAEIGKIYGVSQSVVREVLGVLHSEGLVDIRRGRGGGVFASDHTTSIMAQRLTNLMLYKQVSIAQVRDIRLLLEVNGCRLGAPAMTAGTIATLRQLTDEMENCSDPKQHMRLNEEFHVLLSEQGNSALGILLRPLLRFMSQACHLMTPEEEVKVRHNSYEHYGIIDAIELGDADQACVLLRRHIIEAYYRHEELEKKLLERPILDIQAELNL